MTNQYLPFLSEIVEVIKHTDIEYTFRMRYEKDDVSRPPVPKHAR